MGKANFSDEFKRDAVAQITEPGSATLELNDSDLGRVAARRFDADRVSALAATAVGGPTGERPKLVGRCLKASRLTPRQAFFEWPFWPSENDHGDA